MKMKTKKEIMTRIATLKEMKSELLGEMSGADEILAYDEWKLSRIESQIVSLEWAAGLRA